MVAKKENSSLLRSSLFKGIAITAWVLYLFTLINGVLYFRENSEVRRNAQEESYQQWLNQEDKGPHSAAHYGLYAYKPVPLLSIMDKGMDEYLGTTTWMEAHNQNEVIVKSIDDANSLVRYNSLTIGFVWQFLFPLILLIISFNSVTKEKENGTLTMLLSTGVSGGYILKGKVWGILKAFFLYVFLPQWIILGITLVVNDNGELQRSLMFLFIALFFYSVLYVITINISVALSGMMKTSSQVLILCIGFWISASFILPRLYGSVAKQLYPTPSSYEFTDIVLEQRSKGMDGKGSYEIFQQKLKDSLFAHYKVDRIEDLPIGFAGVALQQSERRDYAAYDKNYGNVQKQFTKQDKFISIGSVFSPILAMRNISFGISETDIYRHFDFTEQAETHRRDIATKMNNDIIEHGSSIGKPEGHKHNAGKELWKTVDNFEYKHAPFTEILSNQWWSIMALGIWFFMTLYFRMRVEQNLKP